jgi:MFS family permease
MEMRAVPPVSQFDRGGLLLLFLGYVSSAMFGLSLGVALPQFMVEFSINVTQAGWLYSAPLWSLAILLTPSGYFADRFGRKRVLLCGYLLLFIGVAATGFSRSYWECLAALATGGAGLGLLVPPYYAMVGEALKRARGLAIGLAAGIYNLGGSIGSVVVGFFVSQQHWRFAYYIMGALVFLMMIVLFVRLKPPPTQTESNAALSVRSSFKSVMKQRNIVVSSISLFIGSFTFYSAAAWLPTFLLSSVGVDAAGVGMIFGSFMLVGVVASPAFGALSDLIRRRWIVCLTGIAAAAVSIAMLTTKYSFWPSVAYSVMLGLLLVPAWSLLITIGQESVREELVTSATGLIQTLGLVGSAVGPIIAGSLIAALGINQGLLCSITLPAVTYAVTALTAVETHRR